MAIHIKTKGILETQRKFRKFKMIIAQGRREPFEEIGKEAVALIRKKTKSGKDYNYKRFKKYSPEYAKTKGQKKVDLEVSEDMLNAISYQAFAKKTRIYVKKKKHSKAKINTYRLAVVHNFGAMAGRNHNAKIHKREFMGFAKKDERKLKLIYKKWLFREKRKVFKK